MTYLDLVKRLKQETGTTGSDPTTVTGLTGEMKRLADWVSQAWVDIQQERSNWQFLRRDFTFNTQVGKQKYTLADIGLIDHSAWVKDSFRIYRTSEGTGNEQFLGHCDYDGFRDYYIFGTIRGIQNTPSDITTAPDESLLLGYVPEDIYTVVGEYYRSPQELTASTDTPLIPSEYHMIIVYEAMVSYGYFDVANEQLALGREKLAKLRNRLVRKYTPSITPGGGFI